MNLTRNFPLNEFTRSRTARKNGIDNSVPSNLMDNIAFLAVSLQTLRNDLSKYFGKDIPIVISSGYRSPKLNRKVGGSKTSDHVKALAADFTSPFLKVAQIYEFIYERRDQYPFIDQCINEYGDWIHLGVDREKLARGQFLVAFRNSKNKTVYEVYEA